MVASNFPNGVSTDYEYGPTGAYGLPDPTKYHTWFDDFDNFESDQWVITTVDGGTDGNEVIAVNDGDNGILTITTNDADDDAENIQWSGDDASTVTETWLVESGKPMWFKARFQLSDATQSDMVIGLCVTDTDVVGGVVDGVYFKKDDGDTNLDFVVTKDSTPTTASAIATLADATYATVAFYFNGIDNIELWVDDVRVGSAASTNIPDNEELAVTMAIQAGEAAAKTMLVDYIYVSKQRL